MFGKIAAGIGALIFAVLVAVFVLPRNQTWSPDGIIYAPASLLWRGAFVGWIAILLSLRARSNLIAPLFAGAGIASIIGILQNPIPSNVARVIEPPLWPVVAAGYA